MALFKVGAKFGVDMDGPLFLPFLQGVGYIGFTEFAYFDLPGGHRDAFFGNFSYDPLGGLAGGVLNHVQENLGGFLHFDISGFSVSAVQFVSLVANGDFLSAFSLALAGADTLLGASNDDALYGFAGNDVMDGGGGYDALLGGDGDDTISSGAVIGTGESFLRGGLGQDYLVGGVNFDDIHGNEGNDTARGGDGDDWVVGGKDRDLLLGERGDDLIYGNMGNDTLDGGAGRDTLRGGQAEDILSGGDGDDWLFGDRGADTLGGGAGADIFFTFGLANLDYVTDFKRGEGDRVIVEEGSSYTVAQSGADVVISMSGGGQMILVGVSLASLTGDWITGG